eukprot:TRINITY_DN14997_c0_g1_i2.p1 TRINITY_DN14997_c0_g1~~TRINITY_DN14997_c0_g1_i2.p1  ORF type:complete len:835 (-),score=199.56 TRINITY_DN14997_c0_g1_i2:130-2634(-)
MGNGLHVEPDTRLQPDGWSRNDAEAKAASDIHVYMDMEEQRRRRDSDATEACSSSSSVCTVAGRRGSKPSILLEGGCQSIPVPLPRNSQRAERTPDLVFFDQAVAADARPEELAPSAAALQLPLRLLVVAQGPQGSVHFRCRLLPSQPLSRLIDRWAEQYDIPAEEVVFVYAGVALHREDMASMLPPIGEQMEWQVINAWPAGSAQAKAGKRARQLRINRHTGRCDFSGLVPVKERDLPRDGLHATASTAAPTPTLRSPPGEEADGELAKAKQQAVTSGMIFKALREVQSRALQSVVENLGNIRDFYEIGEVLGEGSYGIVRQATVKATKATRAVKIISKAQMKKSRVTVELDILKSVDHQNLIKLFEVFQDEEQTTHLVLECCLGGDLCERVDCFGAFCEVHTAHAMTQLLRAVCYLHGHEICHRDLKPENCLVMDRGAFLESTIKVVDFGLSMRLKPGQRLTSISGTPSCMAPEILARSYDAACDLWSSGVICYYLLSAAFPINGKDEDEVKKKVKDGRWTFGECKSWKDISQKAKAFISKLLQKEPEKRAKPEVAMNDAWLLDLMPKAASTAFSPRIAHQLRTFRSLNKLMRAALSFVVSMLCDVDLKASRDLFTALDEDGDGLVSISELAQKIRKSCAPEAIDAPLEAMLKSDVKDFTRYSYTEFLAATLDRDRFVTDDLCWAAFCSFDKDGNGTISMSELSRGFLLGHLCEEELRQTLLDLDTNQDSSVDYKEFQNMLRKRTFSVRGDATQTKAPAALQAEQRPQRAGAADKRCSSRPEKRRSKGNSDIDSHLQRNSSRVRPSAQRPATPGSSQEALPQKRRESSVKQR